jgi:hypothetical protein
MALKAHPSSSIDNAGPLRGWHASRRLLKRVRCGEPTFAEVRADSECGTLRAARIGQFMPPPARSN